MKKNMEEKSNNNKYDNKPYTGGEANDLFRVPDCHANVILKYCDDKTLSNLLTVNKSWNKKINELKWDKRKEYLKYFLWYIYGRGNAERLCKVVDDVVNKNLIKIKIKTILKTLLLRKMMTKIKN